MSYICQAVESHKDLWATKQGKYCYYHFTHEETEVQRTKIEVTPFIKSLLLTY